MHEGRCIACGDVGWEGFDAVHEVVQCCFGVPRQIHRRREKSTAPMATSAVFGSTGLVGSFILTTLLFRDTFATVHTISRRAPKAEGAKLDATVEADTAAWAPKLSAMAPPPHAVFSAVGTTWATAGSLANQWKIDHDLNVELLKAAKAAGAHTFVFVSSAGGGFLGFSPYFKMKAGVENAIKEQGFDNAII